MRSNRQKFRLAPIQLISFFSKRVETVGVQHNRKPGLQNHFSDKILGFRLKSKARTESQNGLAFRYALKTLLSEILNCGGAVRGCYQRFGHKLGVSGSDEREKDR